MKITIDSYIEYFKWLIESYGENLNSTIIDYILQGWPIEEIKTAVKRQFPNESPEKIEGFVEHWNKKIKTIRDKVDNVFEGVKRGELTIERAKRMCSQQSFIDDNKISQRIMNTYFKAKKEQMEEER